MSNKYLATAAFQSSSNEVKYSMFIGRWQPWHAGHRWLIDQRLNEGKKVLLAIRDVEPDERNPWTPQEVLTNLTHYLLELIQEGRVKIIIIPDISLLILEEELATMLLNIYHQTIFYTSQQLRLENR